MVDVLCLHCAEDMSAGPYRSHALIELPMRQVHESISSGPPDESSGKKACRCNEFNGYIDKEQRMATIKDGFSVMHVGFHRAPVKCVTLITDCYAISSQHAPDTLQSNDKKGAHGTPRWRSGIWHGFWKRRGNAETDRA